ncbi:MAG: hypothetical protein LBR06_00130, partial [Bacteroidales bacterium]|nr:hypothetical protein [Bacteroidales bacterium]
YRPLGKYRLIALDNPGYLNSISEMTLTYDSPTLDIPAGYNVLTATGTADRLTLPAKTYQHAVTIEDVLVKGVTYQDATVVAFDYLFAPSGQTVNMTVNALNSSGATVGDPRTLTNIPIAQNRLTTVIGHYFLPNAHLSIIVSDPFEEETEVDYAGKTIDDYININHKTQYSTVHDAIAAAVPGDSIFVPAGTFQVPEKETIPANIVLKGQSNGGTTSLYAPEGFILGGVLQNVRIYQCSTRKTGAPWTTRATGVEMLENSALKSVNVWYYWTGISSEKTTGIVIDGANVSYNYYGITFTGGVAAAFTNSVVASWNDVYGLGLFQGPDAIPENKPTGTFTMRENWGTQFFNAWEDEYLVTPLQSDCYVTKFGTSWNYYGSVANNVYERAPDIDYSSEDVWGSIGSENGVALKYCLGVSVIKNVANSTTATIIRAPLCRNLIAVDIDGTVWGAKNEKRLLNVNGIDTEAAGFYQWNSTSTSWASSWTGSDSTPTTSDTWTAAHPCPPGWRLPTKAEAEHLFSVATVSSESHEGLNPSGANIIADCYRYDYNGSTLYFNKAQYKDETGATITGDGYYWTSESSPTDPTKAIAYHGDTIVEMPRAAGLMVRCVHLTPQSDGTWQ